MMALRLGALDLAIGNLLGSNLFNILILAISDVIYPEGPLLRVASLANLIAAFCVILMYGLFLAGLTYLALKKRMRLT